MTWSKTIPTSTYVLAHRGGANNDKINVAVGMNHALLDVEDAASLAAYLADKVDEIDREAGR